MTNEEFDREFELLYNSINSNVAPSIDLYEKSVFLTQAQEAVVASLYNGSFEKSEQLRRSLDALIVTETPSEASGTFTDKVLSPLSKVYQLPDNVLVITYEQLEVELGTCGKRKVLVVPTTQDEYYKLAKNPFKSANETRALRLDFNNDKVEIISSYPTYTYQIRYLRKPLPIILYNDPSGQVDQSLTINGRYQYTPCELDPSIHRTILEKAVELASISYKQS